MNDKQIYQTASDTLKKLLTKHVTAGGKKERAEGLDLDRSLKTKLMDAKHTASLEKKVGKIDKDGFRPRRLPEALKGAAGKLVGKVTGLKSGVMAAEGAGGLASALGSAGGLAAGLGPALAAAGPALAGLAPALAAAGPALAGLAPALAGAAGPLSLALPVALEMIPVLQEFAAATQRAMEQDLEETRGERERVVNEVQQLLDSVSNLGTTDNLKEQEKAAQEMLDKVRNSNALKLSTPEGMALQRQLAALETNFSPTGMAALKPYSSDAELVAGEFVFISYHFFCIIFNTKI